MEKEGGESCSFSTCFNMHTRFSTPSMACEIGLNVQRSYSTYVIFMSWRRLHYSYSMLSFIHWLYMPFLQWKCVCQNKHWHLVLIRPHKASMSILFHSRAHTKWNWFKMYTQLSKNTHTHTHTLSTQCTCIPIANCSLRDSTPIKHCAHWCKHCRNV